MAAVAVGEKVEEETGAKDDESFPPVPCPDLASYERHSGNVVRPLVDGFVAFNRIYDAIASAKHSVWVVIGFLEVDTTWPVAGSPTTFDVFDAAAARGIDVRVLFWGASDVFGGVFFRSAEHFDLLKTRGTKWLARWDASGAAFPHHSHHEKSWLVDVGQPTETVFTGGMGVNKGTVQAKSTHENAPRSYHDVNVEVTGPAAADLAHSFVQRWNGARGHTETYGAFPSEEAASKLSFPTQRRDAVPGGSAAVQVLRSVASGRYTEGRPPVGATRTLGIETGEASIFEAYTRAFRNAKRYIYCENQHLAHPVLMQQLCDAAARGVQVVYVAPRSPMSAVRRCAAAAAKWSATPPSKRSASRPPYADVFLDKLPALDAEKRFTLLGLAANSAANGGDPHTVHFVYVHAKVVVVDDEWFTVGSANLVDISMHRDHTEVNVGVWDADTARALRVQLLQEHCSVDTAEMDGAVAMEAAVAAAGRNSELVAASRPTSRDGVWRTSEPQKLLCHAFHMNTTSYGL